jgi:hypothetical protein
MDGVELVMAFEEAFGIDIPDEVAPGMITPRDTIDYVATQLAAAPADRCLTQPIFYRLRRGVRSVLGTKAHLTPSTEIQHLADRRAWPGFWAKIRVDAGDPFWPETVPRDGWLSSGPETLRELTGFIAIHEPPPDLERGERWTRERIEWAVRRVIRETIAVERFALDDQYVRDMGVD